MKDKKKNKEKLSGVSSTSFIKQTRWQIAILAVVIFILYGRTLSYDFIGLDEPTLIFENYTFIKDLSNIPQAFKQHVFETAGKAEGSKDYYRPMLTVSFMLDAQFSPDSLQSSTTKNIENPAKIFHLFNILYHLLASVLLLLLLKRIQTSLSVALSLALLFSVHPLLTQAIAWIPGRNDSLIAIFALLSFIYLIDVTDTKHKRSIALHLAFFVLALFTKESAIGIVAIGFLYVLIFKREFIRSKACLFLALSYLLLITAWFLLRAEALKGSKSPITIDIIISTLTENIPLFIQYIQKSILPFNLSVMSTVKDTNYILGVAALFLIGTAFYFGKKENRPMMIFGMGWFLLFLTPSLIAKFFEGLEHRIYLPMIGLFIFLSAVPPFQNFNAKWNKYIIIAIIILFSILTYNRLPTFSNRLLYWESAIKSSNHSSLACLNLGKTYESMGRYQDAIQAYKEGLKRNPQQKLLHNNIGGALIYMKQYQEAEIEIQKELELHPDNNFADYNLGLIKKLQGKPEESFVHFKNSVEKDTNFLQGYEQLADYYKNKKDTMHLLQSIKKIKSLSK